MLAIVMIITVVGAMPFEASAGMYEFLNQGKHPPVFREDKTHWSDADITYENGALTFKRPERGYEKDDTGATTLVTWYVERKDSGIDSGRITGECKTPTEYTTISNMKDLLDAEKMPSGEYVFIAKDYFTHTFTADSQYAYTKQYSVTRKCSGYFTYISPYEMLNNPTNLRWDGDTARWEPVKNADYYYVRLRDSQMEFVDSERVTGTSYDFSAYHPYDGCYFEVQAYSDGDYVHSLTVRSPFYEAYTVTYWPNWPYSTSVSRVPTGVRAGNFVLPDVDSIFTTTPADYAFAGWSTTPDGKNVVDSIYLDENTNLYATWRRVGGNVLYDGSVRYSFDEDTGRLYVLGNGDIPPYTDGYPNPSVFAPFADEIESIEIGPGITKIGDWAFANCTKLVTLDFSHANSLYSIGNSAFSGCTALSDIIYPSDLGVGITGLGSNAFRNCSSLKGFCLSDGEYGQYLSYGVFEGCTSLQSVTLPKTLLTLADTTFKDCESLQMVFYGGTDEDWAELTKYHKNNVLGGARLFTNAAWGIQVGDDAYYIADAFGQTGRITGTGGTYGFGSSPAKTVPVQEVIVEEGITNLGSNFFYGCDFITKLTLPSTLVRIEPGAIQECNGLESLVLPSGVKQLASYSVADNSNLKTLYLSKNLQSVDPAAFTGCTALETVYCDCTRDEFFSSVYVASENEPLQNAQFIPLSGKCGANVNYTYDPTEATLTVSGKGAMDDFTGSSTPTGDLQPRPWYALKYDIKHVVIEDGVTTVGKNAFDSCLNLETVELGKNVQSIGRYAFNGCKALTAVELPESTTSIDVQAFGNCDSIKSVIIPGKLTAIPTCAFVDCPALESVIIPRSVKSIGSNAFWKCPSLMSVYYTGTQDEFLLIDILDGNEQLATATIYLNYENIAGWQYINGSWYYYDNNGNKMTGWVQSGGKWYFLKADGTMATGWVQSSGKWYFMNSAGAMQTGWVQSGGKWYYMESSGAMHTGWLQTGGKWYYMSSSGAMVTGWQKIGGTWYYFESSGAMRTGWLLDGGKWYYLESSGAMLANTSKVINGKKYYFNSSGVCTNP